MSTSYDVPYGTAQQQFEDEIKANMTTLTSVNLGQCPEVDPKILLDCRSITHLNLLNSRLSNDQFKEMSALFPNLQALGISGDDLTDFTPLANLGSGLKSLILNFAKIDDAGLNVIPAEACASLEDLQASSCKDVKDWTAFIASCNKLKSVRLDFTNVSDDVVFPSTLVTLNLHQCPGIVTGAGIAPAGANLIELSLHWSGLDNTGLATICPTLEKVETLNLEHIYNATDFSPVKDCRAVKTLNISYNEVDNAAFSAILSSLPLLEVFEANGVGSVTDFSSLRYLPSSVRFLELDDTKVTGDALKAAVPNFKNLQWLKFDREKITDFTWTCPE